MDTVHKIGRRKTAVARIYLSEGKGAITVNGKDYKSYFTTGTLQYKVQQPLMLTENFRIIIIGTNIGDIKISPKIDRKKSNILCIITSYHRDICQSLCD